MSEAQVLVSVEGGVGRLTLNRPKALHALTADMCRTMAEALLAWTKDPAVTLVLLDHAGGRGFCAGGDIRRMTQTDDPDEAVDFFGTEYRLNHLMFVYPKTIVAVMDGVTMGGGVGVSQPARVRVATEKTLFAMPETGIGLFPDVGGGWYLPRLPGRIGVWLALTGARLRTEDCLALGLATHVVPEADLETFKAELLAWPEALQAAIERYARAPIAPPLAAERADIDRLFAAETVEGIFAALEADGGEWAVAQLAALATKSPLSLKVSLRLMQQGARARSFAEEMAMEYRVVLRMAAGHDFREGVRALLVDRDNKPAWAPMRIEDVTDGMVDAIFAPLSPGDEWTPLAGLETETAQ